MLCRSSVFVLLAFNYAENVKWQTSHSFHTRPGRSEWSHSYYCQSDAVPLRTKRQHRGDCYQALKCHRAPPFPHIRFRLELHFPQYTRTLAGNHPARPQRPRSPRPLPPFFSARLQFVGTPPSPHGVSSANELAMSHFRLSFIAPFTLAHRAFCCDCYVLHCLNRCSRVCEPPELVVLLLLDPIRMACRHRMTALSR